MLIKIQKHCSSKEYMIIEGARDVTYRAYPLVYYSETELLSAMSNFIDGASEDFRRSVWYCHIPPENYEFDFSLGYAVNSLSYTDSQGKRMELLFDGEAFICNDDGKTTQKMRLGGGTAILKDKVHGGNPLAPKAA